MASRPRFVVVLRERSCRKARVKNARVRATLTATNSRTHFLTWTRTTSGNRLQCPCAPTSARASLSETTITTTGLKAQTTTAAEMTRTVPTRTPMTAMDPNLNGHTSRSRHHQHTVITTINRNNSRPLGTNGSRPRPVWTEPAPTTTNRPTVWTKRSFARPRITGKHSE